MDEIQNKRATIRDVAKLAGTSVSTASRVLSSSDYPVSAALRQSVRNAAETLSYVPDVNARALRTDLCRDIGVVLPNISNQFYLQTLEGIGHVLAGCSYNVIFCNTVRQVEKEHEFLRRLYERRVPGVILSSIEEDSETVRKYTALGMKFVLMDQHLEMKDCPCIDFNSRNGARLAVEYLISKGHRRIALATTPLVRWTRNEIYRGYRDALLGARIPFEDRLVFVAYLKEDMDDGDYEIESGRVIAKELSESDCGATAVLCVNDMVAFGLIQGLRSAGLSVPADMSVIGFDDVPFAKAFLPPLTTIRYPSLEVGELAARMLLDNINDTGVSYSMNIELSPKLIVRGTVAPASGLQG